MNTQKYNKFMFYKTLLMKISYLFIYVNTVEKSYFLFLKLNDKVFL